MIRSRLICICSVLTFGMGLRSWAQEPVPAVPAAPVAPPAALPESPPIQGPVFEFLEPIAVAAAPKNWTGGLEFGLAGADGNSEFFKITLGAEAKYEDPRNLYKTTFNYFYASANSIETQNQAFWYTRYERLFPNSPWSMYTTSTLEYDRFRAFDLRLTSFVGAAYAWCKTDRTLFKTRAGAGGSREIGGDDEFRPEMNFGADYEQKIGDRSKFVSRLDYYPDFTDFGDYRIEAQASFETLLSVEHNLSLKLGLLDRYDSTPDGRKPNDVNYTATLLWKY